MEIQVTDNTISVVLYQKGEKSALGQAISIEDIKDDVVVREKITALKDMLIATQLQLLELHLFGEIDQTKEDRMLEVGRRAAEFGI